MKLEAKQKPEFKITVKKETTDDLCEATAEVVTELLNSAVSFHKLHLKITGQGSYAAHKATNKIYDALPNHRDDLAEQSQVAKEELLKYNEKAPKALSSVKEGIDYANELKQMVTSLQSKMPYSEIVNLLDETKSSINSLKYRLLFLS